MPFNHVLGVQAYGATTTGSTRYLRRMHLLCGTRYKYSDWTTGDRYWSTGYWSMDVGREHVYICATSYIMMKYAYHYDTLRMHMYKLTVEFPRHIFVGLSGEFGLVYGGCTRFYTTYDLRSLPYALPMDGKNIFHFTHKEYKALNS